MIFFHTGESSGKIDALPLWAKLAISGRLYFCAKKLIYFRILSSWIHIWREKYSLVLQNFPSLGKNVENCEKSKFHAGLFRTGKLISFRLLSCRVHFCHQNFYPASNNCPSIRKIPWYYFVRLFLVLLSSNVRRRWVLRPRGDNPHTFLGLSMRAFRLWREPCQLMVGHTAVSSSVVLNAHLQGSAPSLASLPWQTWVRIILHIPFRGSCHRPSICQDSRILQFAKNNHGCPLKWGCICDPQNQLAYGYIYIWTWSNSLKLKFISTGPGWIKRVKNIS